MHLFARTDPPGGGTPWNFGQGCAARISKSRPNFRPKNAISHTRFQTWPQKPIPVFRPDLVRDYEQHFHQKIYTRFQTKTAQKPYPLGRHIPIYLIQGSTPPGTDLDVRPETSSYCDITFYCYGRTRTAPWQSGYSVGRSNHKNVSHILESNPFRFR